MKLSTLAGALLLALILTAPVSAQSLPAPYVQVNSPTVKGSAVHVGGGRFLTAAHVVDAGGKNLELEAADGSIAKGVDVIWIDRKHDVAMVAAPPRWISSGNLSCHAPAVGVAIFAHGNPLAFSHLRISGYVAGEPVAFGRWAWVVPIDLTLLPGMSGGALTDASGAVVGLLVGVAAAPSNPPDVATLTGLGLAVPGDVLCDLIGQRGR